MSLLERVTTLVRANLNELLDRAEDPEKMIKQYILDMQNQLIQVKTQVAASIADEQKLYQRYLQNQELAEEWQKKAELAVGKGEDELAKQALQRRNSYQSTADGFKAQYEDQKQQVELLKNALQKLEAKLDESELKKDLLIARSRRAEAEQKIHETMAGIGEAGAMEGFGRMEEKVLEKEARAKAAVELGTDTLEEKFAALEKEADLDDQLQQLKSKMKKPEEGGA
ncbi:MAG: PspA/IM30 family protein [Chloroflexota bacterium]